MEWLLGAQRVCGGCMEGTQTGIEWLLGAQREPMEWLLGAWRVCGGHADGEQRGIEWLLGYEGESGVVARCMEGELISFDWIISIANQNLFWLMKVYK